MLTRKIGDILTSWIIDIIGFPSLSKGYRRNLLLIDKTFIANDLHYFEHTLIT